MLASLHTGEPSVANLLAELKQFGIENEQEGDASVWSAWVLLESDATPGSGDLVTNLLKRTEARPELLHAAMELAVRDRDYSKAVAIQRRLFREEATVANQLKLGELLWLAGDAQSAAIEWKAVMRNRSNDGLVVMFTKELIGRANWKLAANLVNLGIESNLQAWEFLALGIHANIQNKNLSKAAELSGPLLAMKLPVSETFKATDASDVEADTVPLTATASNTKRDGCNSGWISDESI
jgi:hypothetical protein